MGIELLIGSAIAAAVGGGISKARGGSFGRGALIGGLTGLGGVGLDAATGGHVSGVASAKKQKLESSLAAANAAGVEPGKAATLATNKSTLTSDQLLAGNPNILSGTSTNSTPTGRGKILGN